MTTNASAKPEAMPQADSPNQNKADIGFLRPQPLLPGENEQDYRQLSDAIDEGIGPRDVLERLWVRDMAYNQWNVERFRRFTTGLINKWYENSTNSVFSRQMLGTSFGDSASAAQGKEDVDQHLASIASIHINALQHFDAIARRSAAGRDGAYRAIERHREGLGAELATEPENAAVSASSPEQNVGPDQQNADRTPVANDQAEQKQAA